MDKKKSPKEEIGSFQFEVCPSIPNLDTDPYFVAKLERAVQFLKECPIPEWILNRTEKPE